MKKFTNIVIIICLIIFMPSIIFAWVNVFMTATTIIYIAGAGAIYMAITGAKKDLQKKS